MIALLSSFGSSFSELSQPYLHTLLHVATL